MGAVDGPDAESFPQVLEGISGEDTGTVAVQLSGTGDTLRGWAWPPALDHRDRIAPRVVGHFIHEEPDHQQAPPARTIEVGRLARRGRVEARALVPDDVGRLPV